MELPSEASVVRLVGAVLLEQNGERQPQHRSMQVEAMADLVPSPIDAAPMRIPPKAA